MKNRKMIKLIFTIAIVFITLLSFCNIVFATDAASNPSAFKPGNVGNEKELKDRVGVILGAINNIGTVVCIVTLMALGIKYMLGSIEEKAEFKKTATIYITGAILTFSITTIPNILYKIGVNLFNN